MDRWKRESIVEMSTTTDIQASDTSSAQNKMPIESHWPAYDTLDRPPKNYYATWWQAETQHQSSTSLTVTTREQIDPGLL